MDQLPATEGNKWLKINSNGGIYLHGSPYSLTDKARIARILFQLENEAYASMTGAPEAHGQLLSSISSRRLAQEANCGKDTALKVMKELRVHGYLLDPSKQRKKRKEICYGAFSLTDEDEDELLRLHQEIPVRSLNDYQRQLFNGTGAIVSTSTISNWFLYAFPYRGSVVKSNPVPIAKFAAANVDRFNQYAAMIAMVDPKRIKFADEKAMKAIELFGVRTRRNPITGATPDQLVPKDFRVRYNIIGLIGLDDRHGRPLTYSLSQENTTAESFMDFLEDCLIDGSLRRKDMLVIDNAPWHTSGAAANIESFLWNTRDAKGKRFKILVLFLPTYSAELNPIELVWNIFLQLKRDEVLKLFRSGDLNENEAIAHAAGRSMDAITFGHVAGCYRHCGYIE